MLGLQYLSVTVNDFYVVFCRKDEGKTAVDLASGKPQVLKVLNNPPKALHETDNATGAQSGTRQ